MSWLQVKAWGVNADCLLARNYDGDPAKAMSAPDESLAWKCGP